MIEKENPLVSAQEGNEQAILCIYQEYKRLIFKTTKRLTDSPDLAEEFIQECFTKLIPKLPVLLHMKHSSLVSYIATTIRNISYNYYRKEALKSQYFVDEDLSAFGDDDFVQYRDDRPVEDAVLLALEADELNDVLSRLPERDQLLLRGKYQFSLSDEALSRELHCEASSIRMMLTRARNRARALLNEEGITI